MRLAELRAHLEVLAPTAYAEGWDNVGLLAGDPDQDVRRVAFVVDLTQATATAILAAECQLVVAYHPPIFAALKRIDATSPLGRLLGARVGIYSPHTALDVAPGGTNDVLADLFDLRDRAPLRPYLGPQTEYKLVTFVPESALGAVSDALFHAGAGQIGRYASCSFRAPGIGTFYGQEGARPAVGAAGRLEEVAELRLETRVPKRAVDAVIAALRASHPYEEPAFDLVCLAPSPSRSGLGLGRIGGLPRPTELRELLRVVREGLAVEHVLLAGPATGLVTRVAVAAGACGDLALAARQQGAELYLTGEMRHHEAREVVDAGGLTVVAVLHSNSERVAVRKLGARLGAAFPDVEVVCPPSDVDPFRVV